MTDVPSTIKDVVLRKSWKHINAQVGGDRLA